MEIRRLYFVIADISGYTRFVTLHRDSLLHAEKIVGNLLEAVMKEAESTLNVHELLGDAVTLYAHAGEKSADEILASMERMHRAFGETESQHISQCSLCSCVACSNIDKLRLKIIAHVGDAAITSVGGIRKISGEDVILTHRWLKNGIPSREYFLLTEEFAREVKNGFEGVQHSEALEGLGTRKAYYKQLSISLDPPKPALSRKILRHLELNMHAFLRKMGKPSAAYRNFTA